MEFKVGELVVPISKSMGCSLDEESNWRQARKKGQPFLYIARIDREDYYDRKLGMRVDVYVLSFDPDRNTGNHFLLRDLTRYFISNRKAAELLKEY